jgi:hypothetical protein
MAKQQLVLAFFENEAAADQAVDAVKQWDKASKEVKLGAIGILVKDDKGKIKTHKLGARKTGTGAIIFALAAVLTGGASLLAGALFGGIVGSFFRKGLGISKEDLARIDGELDGGKAAVAILAAPDEVEAVSAKLAELGGQPESHELSEEVVQEAETAAAEMPEEAAEAAEEAPAEAAAETPAGAAEEAPAEAAAEAPVEAPAETPVEAPAEAAAEEEGAKPASA